MHKLLGLAAAAALGLFVALPLGAEARTVAVLPLINNVADGEGLESIYYDRSLEVIHKQAGLEMVDGKELEDAVAKYTKVGMVPDKAALQSVAEAANVDLVIVGDIERLEKKSQMTTGTHKVDLTLKGEFASYDRQTGVYTPHKLNQTKQEYAALGSRWDLKSELWAKTVTHELNRILNVKNLNLEGPHISKL